MSDRVVFVHGAGRAGASAWPAQHDLGNVAELVFLERLGFATGEPDRSTDFDEDRRRVLEALGDAAHLVAHSYGAVAALMAADAASDRVQSIALFEPACFSLARGRPAIEAHVESMGAALGDATLSDDEFFGAFLRSVGAEPPPGPLTETARKSARRLRLQRGPWEARLEPATVGAVPTLVVTSGESELSEGDSRGARSTRRRASRHARDRSPAAG